MATKETTKLADILRASIRDPLCHKPTESLAPVSPLTGIEGESTRDPLQKASSCQIEVTTLGRLEIHIKGRAVERKEWQSANARWVFVYLLSRAGQSVPEKKISETFWPGSPPQKAHRALVSSIHRARKALRDSGILVRYESSYGVSRELSYRLDSEELLRAYKMGSQHFYRGNQNEATDLF